MGKIQMKKKLVEVPLKLKDFSKIFKNRNCDVEKFMKKEKLKFKDKEDLIKIFEFYFNEI